MRELEERRAAVLESVREQGKLTPELEAGLVAADTKQRLEDRYAPYKPKRRTKAQIAREAGLDEAPGVRWPRWRAARRTERRRRDGRGTQARAAVALKQPVLLL